MTNRYDELSDRARWFMENFDELDLAELCANQEAAINRVRHLADLIETGAPWTANHDNLVRRIRDALDQPEPAPAANEPPVDRQTALVLAALHRSAEADVSRVISLYERWVKAGPPPIGTSMSRWWDIRLAELHDAILNQPTQPAPPAEQPPLEHAANRANAEDCPACKAAANPPPYPFICPGPETGPAPHNGPSVAECRDADRNWDVEQEGS
jgi:hypothetical protein